MKVLPCSGVLVALLMATGCSPSDDAIDPPPSLTYQADIAPLMNDRCARCHLDGGIAPFPLTSYDEVFPMAHAVADAVANRRMPPGQPTPGCNEYVSSPSLTQEEIDTIVGWVDAGMPEGDPGAAVSYVPQADPLALSRVDLRISMPGAYTPTTMPDDYRCFLIDWPEQQLVYVTGFGVEQGNAAMVHHVIAYLATPDMVDAFQALDDADPAPGYACYGGPGIEGAVPWIGGWAPGQEGRDNAEGTGLPIPPGSKVIMQVHYHVDASTSGQTDQSSVLLKIDPVVDLSAQVTPWFDKSWALEGTLQIPAGSMGVTYTYAAPVTTDLRVYDVGMHMHGLGRSGSVTVSHSDGTETCLLRLDDWDFNWQLNYRLAEPARLVVGDLLKVTCVFDNPGQQDVYWGDGTDDEMCLGITYSVAVP